MTTSYRARPLPPTPTLGPPPVLETATSTSHNGNNRNTVLTFNTISTDLPRYSTIDFSDPAFILEQVDHWGDDVTSNTENSGPDSSGPDTTAPGVGAIPAATPTIPVPSQPAIPTTPVPPQPSEHATVQNRTQRRWPNFTLHKFYLKRKGKTGKPWATLKLISRSPAPGSQEKYPRFIGGDTLRGSVDINLDAPMNIHDIKFELRGKVALTKDARNPLLGKCERVFLDESYPLFSKKTSGDPRWNGQCEISKNKPHDGSMHGSYSFPFTISFPTSVSCANSKQDRREMPQAHDPPPSFKEKGSSYAVVYEIVLVIGHGSLRSTSKVAAGVIFVPKKVSPPASDKRQAAYLEGALIPGPSADPEGWQEITPLTLQGQFQDRAVEVTCVLTLAKPLSYTRGTVIPCHLKLSSLDFQFLDNLATPNTINLRLSRHVWVPWLEKEPNSGSSYGSSTRTQRVQIANAVWWRPAKTDHPEGSGERQLEGEIHLDRQLMPSCNFPLFAIEYVLELMPFTLDPFAMTSGLDKGRGEGAILEHLVNISNFHEYGPVPVPFTPRRDAEREGLPRENHRRRGPSRTVDPPVAVYPGLVGVYRECGIILHTYGDDA